MYLIDVFFEKVLLAISEKLYEFSVNYLKNRGKIKTGDQGHLPVWKVSHQGAVVNFFSSNNVESKISDLPRVLYTMVSQLINDNFLIDKTHFYGYEKCVFRVNSTRFSTFFVFTDGARVLFHCRHKGELANQTIESNRYDMFGSVSFENCTLGVKIGNKKGFLDKKPRSINLIPGFAFEDTNESISGDLFSPRTTVVMIGFCIFMDSEDLDCAESIAQKSIIEIFPISDTPAADKLTSKANLAINYLKQQY